MALWTLLFMTDIIKIQMDSQGDVEMWTNIFETSPLNLFVICKNMNELTNIKVQK